MRRLTAHFSVALRGRMPCAPRKYCFGNSRSGVCSRICGNCIAAFILKRVCRIREMQNRNRLGRRLFCSAIRSIFCIGRKAGKHRCFTAQCVFAAKIFRWIFSAAGSNIGCLGRAVPPALCAAAAKAQCSLLCIRRRGSSEQALCFGRAVFCGRNARCRPILRRRRACSFPFLLFCHSKKTMSGTLPFPSFFWKPFPMPIRGCFFCIAVRAGGMAKKFFAALPQTARIRCF